MHDALEALIKGAFNDPQTHSVNFLKKCAMVGVGCGAQIKITLNLVVSCPLFATLLMCSLLN